MELTSEEKAAECIYHQMRLRKLTRDEFVRRMELLDRTHEGRIASSYCTFLLLKSQPPSAEKEFHMNQLAARVQALSRS